jgi:hypothetical protein
MRCWGARVVVTGPVRSQARHVDFVRTASPKSRNAMNRVGGKHEHPFENGVTLDRHIAELRPSKNRTGELTPHPAQGWMKPLVQAVGTSV